MNKHKMNNSIIILINNICLCIMYYDYILVPSFFSAFLPFCVLCPRWKEEKKEEERKKERKESKM